MIVLLLIGVTQVVIPILQGKSLFPMLHQQHASFDERIKGIEAELERSRRMDQIGKEVDDMFESRLEIRPTEKKKGKN